jgi:general stress protein YciG
MPTNDNTSKRGFASMNEDEQRDIASQGGKASSAKQDMSELGKKGAAAQPREAKVKGGKNSHRNE